MNYGTQKTSLRLTDTERKVLKTIADKRGVNMTDAIRQLIAEEQQRLIAKQ